MDATDSSNSPDNEVLTGEVVGYDLISFVSSALEALDKASKNHHLDRKYANVCAALLQDWGNQLAQQGVQTIHLESY
jgi:hypothetical protein